MTRAMNWLRSAFGRCAFGPCALGLYALAGGCDESGPRVYTAQLYQPDLDCVETYSPLGLVEGTSLSALCEPVCLALGEELYVSTVCAPYPAEVSIEPADSESCAAALAAVAGELACEATADAGLE